jgi:hypothetical protein
MSSRRTIRSIALSDLKPGDILLSRGVGELADVICSVDGGTYSHAAVWDGERVVEATLGGIYANPIEQGLDVCPYVDVYRFHRKGCWLGDDGWSADPIQRRARCYVGDTYLYPDLLMATLVVALGRRTSVAAMARIVSSFGDRVGRSIAGKLLLATGRASPASTSTALVAAIYHEAASTPEHRYALDVSVRSSALGEGSLPAEKSAKLEAEYRELSAQWRAVLLKAAPHLARDLASVDAACTDVLGTAQARLIRAGGPELPASCVTPRDLETSPSLECYGRLPGRICSS